MNTLILLSLVLLSQDTSTLKVKSVYEVGEPIEIGCVCAPAPGKTIVLTWKAPTLTLRDKDQFTKYAWAKPGNHRVDVDVFIIKTRIIKVFVPDPDFPADVTKAKLQDFEVLDGVPTSEKLEGMFVQKGSVTPDPPPVDPDDPVDPPPPPAPKGIKQVILMYEFSRLPHPWSAEDPRVEEWLHANVPGSWNRWDDDYVAGSFKKYGKTVEDLYLFGKGSRPDNEPTLVVEFKDGQKKSYVLPEQADSLIKLMEGFK